MEVNVAAQMSEIRVYAPVGRLDSQTAAGHEAAILALINPATKGLVLDMAGVSHLSTAGIRVLLMVSRACQDAGIGLMLHSLTPATLEVIRITGLDEHLNIRLDAS